MEAAGVGDGTALMHLPTVMTLIQDLTIKLRDAEAAKRENEELKEELERLRKHAASSSAGEGGIVTKHSGASTAPKGASCALDAPLASGSDPARLFALGAAQERGHTEYEEMKRELEKYKQKYHRELHANEERVQRVVKLDADRVRLEDEVKRLRADAEGLREQLRGLTETQDKNEELAKTVEKLRREKDALVLELAIAQQNIEDLARLTDAGLRAEVERLKHDLHAKDAQLKHSREEMESMRQAFHRRRDSMSSTATRHRSQPPVGRIPEPGAPPPVPPLPRPSSMMVASSSASAQKQTMPRPSSMSAIPGAAAPRRVSHRSTKSQHVPGSMAQGRLGHVRPLAELMGFANEKGKGKGKERAVPMKGESEIIEIPDDDTCAPPRFEGLRSVMPEGRRKALDKFPEVVADMSEEMLQRNAFSRTQLQSVLGGNKQALIARIAADRRGEKKVARKHGVTMYLCPGLDLNPWCPDAPGKHGYMFVGLGIDAGTFSKEETCPLFVTVAPQKCMYMGTYRAQRVQGLTTEEWRAMDSDFKERYAFVTTKKTSKLSQSDAKQIRADYDNGVLRVPCVQLICVGFEDDFVQDILDALQLQLPTPTASPSAKAMGKRRREAAEDDDAYEGDVGEPTTPIPLRKSPRNHR